MSKSKILFIAFLKILHIRLKKRFFIFESKSVFGYPTQNRYLYFRLKKKFRHDVDSNILSQKEVSKFLTHKFFLSFRSGIHHSFFGSNSNVFRLISEPCVTYASKNFWLIRLLQFHTVSLLLKIDNFFPVVNTIISQIWI